MKDILNESGQSTATVDIVKKVFFDDDPTSELLRHRIGEKPFARGLVPKDLMNDARFANFSDAGSTTLVGDGLKAVVDYPREAAVDGSVQTVDTNAALEFCNRERWLQRVGNGAVEKFEVPSKLHLW